LLQIQRIADKPTCMFLLLHLSP